MVRTAVLALLLAAAPQEAKPPRTPWTSSRITGSPDPPPPHRAERAFPNLTFKKPVHLVPMPGHARYVVIEEDATLWTFRNDPACAKPDLLIDLKKEIPGLEKEQLRVQSSYALAFDPDFAKNRFCYVMYVLSPTGRKKPLPEGSRVSRFKVTETDPPRLDPASEEILITWLSGGHNGCDLQFGNDGNLYISTGDAEDPSPPDKLRTGQDCTDLLSSILRIDVRRSEAGRKYAIPADNPFAGAEGIRPEIWAYGFRNPWRMSFHRATGRLWVGDVGWERWELVLCAERGGNYGWSVMEGHEVCIPDAKRGPTPILPVAHVIPHPLAASITGGFVYRGKKLKGFEGWYIYGDWETRRIFANPVQGATLGPRVETARTDSRIIAFAEEADGELLMLDHLGGGVYRIAPDDAGARNADFPRRLSQSGLFSSTREQTPSPGVIPYAANASRWADGAVAQRWVAIPGLESITFVDKNREWPKESVWPKDSVLAKTLTLEGRRVETQILHYDGRAWSAYTYVWNGEQTDATLAPAEGAEVDLGGGRTWKAPARAACMSCHGPWAGYALTFNSAQLGRDNQVQAFQDKAILPKKLVESKPLVDPRDETAPLDARARSYLAVNCASCHRFGGGGSARIDLRHEVPAKEMNLHNVRPSLGGFDLPDPYLVSGGDPARSVLLYRISKLGGGRMPHQGSDVVDVQGANLIRAWIASLPAVPCEAASRAEETRALERLRGGDATALDRLLASPCGALELLGAIDALPEGVRAEAVRRALSQPPGPVRDLFERFEPAGRRRKRLGLSIRPAQVLDVKGDAVRGKRLFESSTIQCSKCHVVGGAETVGPDLLKVGGKYTRVQLLESLLEPSKTVDPKYSGWIVQTKNGDVFSGLLASKTDAEIVLREVDRTSRLKAGDVQRMVQQQKSIMPEGLLQHLTAEEAADLLAYLESLK